MFGHERLGGASHWAEPAMSRIASVFGARPPKLSTHYFGLYKSCSILSKPQQKRPSGHCIFNADLPLRQALVVERGFGQYIRR